VIYFRLAYEGVTHRQEVNLEQAELFYRILGEKDSIDSVGIGFLAGGRAVAGGSISGKWR
jgi:hypothetical protein